MKQLFYLTLSSLFCRACMCDYWFTFSHRDTHALLIASCVYACTLPVHPLPHHTIFLQLYLCQCYNSSLITILNSRRRHHHYRRFPLRPVLRAAIHALLGCSISSDREKKLFLNHFLQTLKISVSFFSRFSSALLFICVNTFISHLSVIFSFFSPILF